MESRQSDLPHVKSISRISKLPIVEDGIQIASSVYVRIKRSNFLINWGLNTAEQSLVVAKEIATPAINVFSGPITVVDHLLCKGIDVVEEKVPAVHLPPRQMYINAKDYVCSKVEAVLSPARILSQLASIKNRIERYVSQKLINEIDDVIEDRNANNAALTTTKSNRWIKELINVLILMGTNFLVTLTRMLIHPRMALLEVLDLLRQYTSPTDKREADTLTEAFQMLLGNVQAFGRCKLHEISVTLDPLFRAEYGLMTARMKIYNAVQEYFTLLAKYLPEISFWLMFSVKRGVWNTHDHLCKMIHLYLVIVIILAGSVSYVIIPLLGFDYSTRRKGNHINIKMAVWLLKTIRSLLTRITKMLVGERNVPMQMQNHHRNGIEH
ncbi:uncharacterized protein LOC117220048 isoform X1 [Megalopta genalis]|uniref:uncharacterized protein LOC117220048 isoform X1 n=1 Tax=Megalopta genalis TaxID=115081 RepID=UPI003FD6909A